MVELMMKLQNNWKRQYLILFHLQRKNRVYERQAAAAVCLEYNKEFTMKNYVFQMPLDRLTVIKAFTVEKLIENDRTVIYQNKSLRMAFDKKVVRVLVFQEDETIERKLYRYFYETEELNKWKQEKLSGSTMQKVMDLS